MNDLDAAGVNGIVYDSSTNRGYIIHKTKNSNTSSITTGPYIATTGPTLGNSIKGVKSMYDIDMNSNLGAGQEYIRKCVREILLDRDSFPEERKALLDYLQNVLFDMIEPENLEEIQRKFAGISIDADKRIKDLLEKLKEKESTIYYLESRIHYLQGELEKANKNTEKVENDYYRFRSELPSIIREEVSRIINPRY